ncbi:MAG: sugar phosphate nucleotidyltransferase [Nitrososphaerota archaeon]
MVFAAGYGRRLYPLTSSRPKHLLPLAGTPLILRVLEALRTAGIRELGVTVGYMSEKVADLISRFGAAPIFQSQIAGTGQALRESKPFLMGEDRFFVVYGDVTVTASELIKLYRYVEENDLDGGLIAVKRRGEGLYGVVRTKDGLLTSIAEKSSEPGPVNAGIYLLPREILDIVEVLERSPRGEYELTDGVNMLALKGFRIGVIVDEGSWWFDIGRPVDYYAANLYYIMRDLGGRIHLDRMVEMGDDVMFRGPVIVGRGARIGGGCVLDGPLVVGEESVIGSRVHISRSVLMEQVSISSGCRIRDSVISERTVVGEGVEVSGDDPPCLVTGPGAQVSGYLKISKPTII